MSRPVHDLTCPVCGAAAQVRSVAQPGYVDGTLMAVLGCGACKVAYVSPERLDPSIYDRIYAHAGDVPGYARYKDYAARVLESAQPLDELANSEETYSAIRNVLRGRNVPPAARVLEIGSGLGYLTYALNREGYRCLGVDISAEAVRAASARYGDHYVCAPVESFAIEHRRQYDVVVATEVVEHLPDAPTVFRTLVSLLRPGGCLVITTPNKSLYSDDVLWETEPPPVHLWWFSEPSVRALADELSCSVRFVDFAEFYRGRYATVRRPPSGLVPSRGPRLAAGDGVRARQVRPVARSARWCPPQDSVGPCAWPGSSNGTLDPARRARYLPVCRAGTPDWIRVQ